MKYLLHFVISFLLLIQTSFAAGPQAGGCFNPAPQDFHEIESFCNQLISSEVCQSIAPESRKTCHEESVVDMGWDFIKGCAEGVLESVVDIIKFIGMVMEFVWDSVTGKKDFKKGFEKGLGAGKSALLYLDVEYQKAYEEASFPRTFNALKAMGGKIAKAIYDSSSKFISKQVANFECLNNEARSEMICRFLGQAFLPPVAILGILRGGKVFKNGFQGIKEGTNDAMELMKRKFQRKKAKPVKNVEELNGRYVNYNPTNPKQNKKWIEKAKANDADLYIDVENAAIKRLNDSLGDKNIVTSMTNLHKEQLFKNLEEVFKKYPGVKVSKYSDFKSSRFALEGRIPPGMKADIAAAIRKTNEDVTHQLHKLDIPQKLITDDNIAGWFSSGIGNSADKAGLAAREARTHARRKGIHPTPTINFTTIEETLGKRVAKIDQIRQKIVDDLSKVPAGKQLLSRSEPGNSKLFLNRDAFEVLRKENKNLGPALKEKYGLELSAGTLDDIRHYYKSVDSFSPGIWIDKRVVASLDDAEFGGFSADFTGMGASNVERVAKDLGSESADVTRVLSQIRKGEEKVTETFNDSKTFFSNHVETQIKKMKTKVKSLCSGDDCVGLVKRAMAPTEKKQLIKTFIEKRNPSSIRLSFIPPGLPRAIRSKMAVTGEVIEKEIRKKITGVGSSKIPADRMKEILIALDMPKSVRGDQVNLLLGIGKDASLSPAEKQIIQKAFRETLKDLDKKIEFDKDFMPKFDQGNIQLIQAR